MRSSEKTKPREKPAENQALDRELEDTFPASDPPQMTRADDHVGGPRRSEDIDKAKRRGRR